MDQRATIRNVRQKAIVSIHDMRRYLATGQYQAMRLEVSALWRLASALAWLPDGYLLQDRLQRVAMKVTKFIY